MCPEPVLQFLRTQLPSSSSLKASLKAICVFCGIPKARKTWEFYWPAPPVWRLLNLSWAGLQFLGILLASSSSLKAIEFVLSRPSILGNSIGQLLQFEGYWICPEQAFNSWEFYWPAPPVWRLLNLSWADLQFLGILFASSSSFKAIEFVLSRPSILGNSIGQLLQFEGYWICPEQAFNSWEFYWPAPLVLRILNLLWASFQLASFSSGQKATECVAFKT